MKILTATDGSKDATTAMICAARLLRKEELHADVHCALLRSWFRIAAFKQPRLAAAHARPTESRLGTTGRKYEQQNATG
jgi:hypothetical protein